MAQAGISGTAASMLELRASKLVPNPLGTESQSPTPRRQPQIYSPLVLKARYYEDSSFQYRCPTGKPTVGLRQLAAGVGGHGTLAAELSLPVINHHVGVGHAQTTSPPSYLSPHGFLFIVLVVGILFS